MATYDREILVPYLQNVCSLQLLKKRLEDEKAHIESFIAEQKVLAQQGTTPDVPQPRHVSASGGWIPLILLGILLFGMFSGYSLISFFVLLQELSAGDLIMLLIFQAIGIVSLIFLVIKPIGYFANAKRLNKYNQEEYLKASRRAAEAQEEEKAAARKKIQNAGRSLGICKDRLEEVEKQLQQVYSANIIPKTYRNIYASIYLYEWFSTSAADDLDHALNMFVLEEMKEDLDLVIHNQTAAYLQQQAMISHQEASAEMLSRRLEQLQISADEHARYSRMIAASTSASAFFAAANYLDS